MRKQVMAESDGEGRRRLWQSNGACRKGVWNSVPVRQCTEKRQLQLVRARDLWAVEQAQHHLEHLWRPTCTGDDGDLAAELGVVRPQAAFDHQHHPPALGVGAWYEVQVVAQAFVDKVERREVRNPCSTDRKGRTGATKQVVALGSGEVDRGSGLDVVGALIEHFLVCGPTIVLVVLRKLRF